MYIETVPNRNSPPAILLREGWRENGKVRKRTLANLSKWPREKIETLRRLLKDEPLVGRADAFDIVRSLPHGHVAAVLGTMRKLGLDRLIDPAPSPERARVLAMVAARILDPGSKLATARGLAEATARDTLAETLALGPLDEDDLYAAMDWLLERQDRIERGLAKRHLAQGTLVLYDLTSVWMEGRTCPLAKRGHSRDGKRGKLQIEFGLLCARDGCPVSVEVFAGHIADPSTVGAQVGKLRQRFGLSRVVLVGDRGMLTEARIREEVKPAGLRLGQRAARAGHPRAGGLRRGAVVAVRRARPGGGHQRRLPRGASDGVPQSAVGRGAREEARRPARRHRGGARPHCRGDPAHQAPPARREQNRGAGGPCHRPVQDGQALRVVHRQQGRVQLPAHPLLDCGRGRPRRTVRGGAPACPRPHSMPAGPCARTSV